MLADVVRILRELEPQPMTRRQLEDLIAEEGLPIEETLARLVSGQSTTDNSELSH